MRASLMALVALLGWGCDVCATSERMAIFENLPMCPTEAESDAGIVEVVGEGPWTFDDEEQRWREPDRTSPIITPVDVHIPENVQRVLPLSPRQYRVEVSGDGCLPGHDVVAQMGGSFRIEWPDRLIQTFSTECRIKPRNAHGSAALANEYIAELGRCAQENDFKQPDGNGRGWRWTNPLDPRFGSTAEAYVHAQDRLFSCAAEACAAANDFEAQDEDADGLNDTCDCVEPESEDVARCWLSGDETDPPTGGGLPGLRECPDGEGGEPVCQVQERWPTIQAWYDDRIEPALDNPNLIAQARAQSAVSYRFIDGENQVKAQADADEGHDFERYLKAHMAEKWGVRYRRRGTYIAGPLNKWIEYATASVDGEHSTSPSGEVENVVMPGGRVRHSDGQSDAIPDPFRPGRQAEPQILHEAKCMNPWLQFGPGVNPGKWGKMKMMQFGFFTQLWDYVNYVDAERGAMVTNRIIQYYFCRRIPLWANRLLLLMYAGNADRGSLQFEHSFGDHFAHNDQNFGAWITIPIYNWNDALENGVEALAVLQENLDELLRVVVELEGANVDGVGLAADIALIMGTSVYDSLSGSE